MLARAQVPTFTNPNNVAIVTGVSAARNGVAGNHYLDDHGEEVQVTDPAFLRATTIHSAAAAAGVPVLCVTAKDKRRRLLATGRVPAFSAELAHEQTLEDGTPIVEVVGGRILASMTGNCRPTPSIWRWRWRSPSASARGWSTRR
jgi:phosphonoacetate hydrolase